MINTPDRSNSLSDLAARIRSEHEAALLNMRRGLEHAIAAGNLLIEAKAQLKHGQWLPWLEEVCPALPERTATHYMRLARHAPELESKSATVADLTVRGALELLAPPKRASDFPHWRDWAESFDDLNEWAKATSREPFTDYDADQERADWLNQSMWKLATVAGAPAEAIMLLQLGDEHDLPTVHALHPGHINELTAAIAPYAKGEKAVEIDAKNLIDVALSIKVTAQCFVGLMFREFEERQGLSPEEVDDRAQRLMAELTASIDAAREAIERNRRGEPVNTDGRRGKTWDTIRALVAARAGAAPATGGAA
jgi:hypothetical protein